MSMTLSNPTIDQQQLDRVEKMLLSIQHTLDIQSAAIAKLQHDVTAAQRNHDWYHVQFGQMVRIIARDLRELRSTLICSVITDGPITAQTVESLLRRRPEDVRELELPQATRRHN